MHILFYHYASLASRSFLRSSITFPWFYLISFNCDFRSSSSEFLSDIFRYQSYTYFFLKASSDFYCKILLQDYLCAFWYSYTHDSNSFFFYYSSLFISSLCLSSSSFYFSQSSLSSSFMTSISKLIISISERYWVSALMTSCSYFLTFSISFEPSATLREI